MSLSDRIRKMAARKDGVASDEITGYTSHQVGNACCQLAHRGDLHRVVVSYRHTRYFTTEEGAKAYAVRLANMRRFRGDSSMPAPAAHGRVTWKPDTPAIVTEHTRITVCPPYMPRFAALDLPGIVGANQRGRVHA